MSKKQRELVVKIFAIIFIIAMVVGSFANVLFFI